jgi:hypothetical protein
MVALALLLLLAGMALLAQLVMADDGAGGAGNMTGEGGTSCADGVHGIGGAGAAVFLVAPAVRLFLVPRRCWHWQWRCTFLAISSNSQFHRSSRCSAEFMR